MTFTQEEARRVSALQMLWQVRNAKGSGLTAAEQTALVLAEHAVLCAILQIPTMSRAEEDRNRGVQVTEGKLIDLVSKIRRRKSLPNETEQGLTMVNDRLLSFGD